jgi:hypothetical protein
MNETARKPDAPVICARRRLAVWFAFYGDADDRDIHRRAVGEGGGPLVQQAGLFRRTACGDRAMQMIDTLFPKHFDASASAGL